MADLTNLRLVALLICALFAAACQREEPPATAPFTLKAAVADRTAPPAAPQTPAPPEASPSPDLAAPVTVAAGAPLIFMESGTTLHRGETLTDALPVWRRFTTQKPTLLLLSNDPALLPPPNELRPQIDTLMTTSPDTALRQAGSPLQAAPLFLPGMTVDLALRQGWLRELVWVFPQIDPAHEVKLETLRQQLTANRLADADEAAALTQDGKLFTGRLRGRPFRAAPLGSQGQIDGPVIVHIDLSYFQKIHKNEIATPVIPLVGSVVQELKRMRLPVLAVTFSYNHAEGELPLGVRFLGEFVAALVEKPERLDQPLPRRWQAQKDILYLENFFQKDDIRKLVEQQAQETPDAAWVQFNRYHTAALFKEDDLALEFLDRAVALDRWYALEYLTLASRAGEMQRPDRMLAMMQRAAAALPDNLPIKLKTAEVAMMIGDMRTARTLVEELRRQPWSPVYFPDMPGYLDTLLAQGSNGPSDASSR